MIPTTAAATSRHDQVRPADADRHVPVSESALDLTFEDDDLDLLQVAQPAMSLDDFLGGGELFKDKDDETFEEIEDISAALEKEDAKMEEMKYGTYIDLANTASVAEVTRVFEASKASLFPLDSCVERLCESPFHSTPPTGADRGPVPSPQPAPLSRAALSPGPYLPGELLERFANSPSREKTPAVVPGTTGAVMAVALDDSDEGSEDDGGPRASSTRGSTRGSARGSARGSTHSRPVSDTDSFAEWYGYDDDEESDAKAEEEFFPDQSVLDQAEQERFPAHRKSETLEEGKDQNYVWAATKDNVQLFDMDLADPSIAATKSLDAKSGATVFSMRDVEHSQELGGMDATGENGITNLTDMEGLEEEADYRQDGDSPETSMQLTAATNQSAEAAYYSRIANVRQADSLGDPTDLAMATPNLLSDRIVYYQDDATAMLRLVQTVASLQEALKGVHNARRSLLKSKNAIVRQSDPYQLEKLALAVHSGIRTLFSGSKLVRIVRVACGSAAEDSKKIPKVYPGKDPREKDGGGGGGGAKRSSKGRQPQHLKLVLHKEVAVGSSEASDQSKEDNHLARFEEDSPISRSRIIGELVDDDDVGSPSGRPLSPSPQAVNPTDNDHRPTDNDNDDAQHSDPFDDSATVRLPLRVMLVNPGPRPTAVSSRSAKYPSITEHLTIQLLLEQTAHKDLRNFKYELCVGFQKQVVLPEVFKLETEVKSFVKAQDRLAGLYEHFVLRYFPAVERDKGSILKNPKSAFLKKIERLLESSLPAFYREILFEIRRAHAIRSYVLSHTADRSTSKIVRDSAARSILEDAFSRVGVNQEVVTEVQRKVLEEKLSVEEVSRTSTKSLVHLLPLIGAGASGGAGGVADGGGIERRGGMEQKRRAIVSQVVLGKKWREQVPRGG